MLRKTFVAAGATALLLPAFCGLTTSNGGVAFAHANLGVDVGAGLQHVHEEQHETIAHSDHVHQEDGQHYSGNHEHPPAVEYSVEADGEQHAHQEGDSASGGVHADGQGENSQVQQPAADQQQHGEQHCHQHEDGSVHCPDGHHHGEEQHEHHHHGEEQHHHHGEEQHHHHGEEQHHHHGDAAAHGDHCHHPDDGSLHCHDDGHHAEHAHHHDHDHGHQHGHSHDHSHDSSASAAPPAFHAALTEAEKHPWTAVSLTFLSGMAATVGGLFVVLLGQPSPALLGHLLSFAAGIMLYISYGDLLPHAIADLDAGAAGDGHDHGHHGHSHGGHDEGDGHGHVHGPGLFEANVWLFAGMAFFALIALGMQWLHFDVDGEEGEGAHGHSHGGMKHQQHAASKTEQANESSAAAGAPEAAPPTAIKGKRAASVKGGRARAKSTSTSAAAAVEDGDADPAAAGAVVVASKSNGNPKVSDAHSSSTTTSGGLDRRRLLMTGMVAAVGITLHNLPEGLIVYNQTITGICTPSEGASVALEPPVWGSLPWLAASVGLGGQYDVSRCLTRGVAVTLAIALHNIPEGMAVASPIYASTGSKWQALKWTFLSSLAEPLAAVVFGLLYSSNLTRHMMACLNAFVAGIMIMLCLAELIPAAAQSVAPKEAAISNVIGQAAMFISLHAMRSAGVH